MSAPPAESTPAWYEPVTEGRGSTSCIPVVLVGRTGLEGALRLDPEIVLTRVNNPLEAIAELGGIASASGEPAAAVESPVLVVDAASDVGNGREFVGAARRVAGNVRVLRVIDHNEQGALLHAFDGLVPPGASPADLRALVRGRLEQAAEHGQVDVKSPAPAVRAPSESPVSPAASSSADGELVAGMLRGHDILPLAISMLGRRHPGATIDFVADAEVDARPQTASDFVAVDVKAGNWRYGRLFCKGLGTVELGAAAEWLANWLRLQDQHIQLREAAFTDPLTGAWNRRYFDRYLRATIERAREARQTVTVLVFDLDGFKTFNDRYGHPAADDILKETVRLLRSVVRPDDRVCRIGGDEFAVIFYEPEGPRQPGSVPPTSVYQLADRFQKQIAEQRFPKLGVDAPGSLTISGGLATYPWDGATAEELVQRADTLACRGKQEGKNVIRFGPPPEG